MTRILFSAGELSGDEHGAHLLRDLKKLYPDGEFYGMGGKNLRAAGLEIVVDAEKSASVMGVSEVFSGLRSILASWKTMNQLFVSRRPDVLVIINYSEFNLRLARKAKQQNIKVLFYIPPQVWAWRPGRVKEINQVCDIVATIFPFERDFYLSRGCNRVVYVGHPLISYFSTQRIDDQARKQLIHDRGLDPAKPILVLFPGSRRKEILAHLEFVFETFRKVKNKAPEVQGLLVSASPMWVDEFQQKAPAELGITVTTGESIKLLQIGRAGLIKSGTSNLQATFARLPFVMFYRPSLLTGAIIRLFVKGIKEYSIVNIIRPKTTPEIVGEFLNPTKAAEELLKILADTPERQRMLSAFDEIMASLSGSDQNPIIQGCTTASERTARLIQSLVDVPK